MRSRPLDYASPDTPRLRRWPWRALVAGVVLLLAMLVLPSMIIRQVESRVDPVTGSMSWNTVWLFGFTSGPRIDVSPLEVRLRNSGVQWTPSWKTLHNTHRNIFGSAICYECSSAPPIYDLRPMLKEFAAASTDDELREWVRVMQFGTREEQAAAVDAAAEKALQ